MSSYTYNLTELPALGIITAPISYNNLKADGLKLRYVPANATSTLPWSEDDRITLTETLTIDGVTSTHYLFSGIISTITYTYTGDALNVDIQLYNDVSQLERTIYVALQDDGSPAFSAYFGGTTSMTSVLTVLSNCYDMARNSGHSLMTSRLDATVDATLPVVVGNGCSSCFSLMRDALKWSPDVYSYMSYDASGNTLHYAHAASLRPVLIDLTTKTVTHDVNSSTAATYASLSLTVDWRGLVDLATITIDGTDFQWLAMNNNDDAPESSYSDESVAAWNAYFVSLVNASNLSVTAELVDGSIILTAKTAGVSGNSIEVSVYIFDDYFLVEDYYSVGLIAINGDESLSSCTLSGGAGASSTVQTLGTFEQITNCALTPRPDLIPPCVALTGAVVDYIPSTSSPTAPNSLVYHIPANGYMANIAEMTEEEAYQVASKIAPTQTVKGLELPSSWEDGTANLRTLGSTDLADCISFWSRFPSFKKLASVSESALLAGSFCVEVTDADAAYPSSELEELNGDEAVVPANYDAASTSSLNWQRTCMLIDGSFPASSEDALNVAGLKYCLASLRQIFVLTTANCGLTAEEWVDFFLGTESFITNGTDKKCRYVCLSCDCVLINRRKKVYKEGTNELQSGDEDYEEEEDDDSTSSTDDVSAAEYRAMIARVYEDTRHLYYDGSLTLLGCNLPASWLIGSALSIKGLNPAWEDMATPVTAVNYDPFTKRVDITVGSRQYLSIDEQVARQQAINSVYSSATTKALTDSSSLEAAKDDSDDDDDDDSDAVTQLIAPSISTYSSASLYGRQLAPFEVYAEGDTWYVAEGVVDTPDGDLVVPKREVSSGLPAGHDLKVTAVYNSTTNQYEAVYRSVARTTS